MQIAYSTKYSQLFCVVLLLCIVCNSAQICDSNNFTSAKFESNLNIVIKNLENNTSSSNGFNTSVSGQSPYTVYGLLQCRGDATLEECFSCSQSANTNVRQSCGNARGGRACLEKCFIRYETYSFFGKLDTNSRVFYNIGKVTDQPDVFSTAVRELLTNLSDQALRSPIRYSSGSTTTSTFYRINGLLQCWRDLTSTEDCKICLTNAIRGLLSVTLTDNGIFQGGVTCSGSCIARYETYNFFHPAPPPPPSPLQLFSPPLIQQPPLSSPTPSKKSPKKIGIILGIVGGFLFMLLLCLFAIRRRVKPAVSWMSALLRKEKLDREEDSVIGQEQEIIFNLENIKAATRNFHEDNKLGQGGFGAVYKGTMPNGVQIAVKRLSVQSLQGKKQFVNEVKLVARIQHRNLVNLLGCCAEGSERLLVYEFLSNKSLDKILFRMDTDPQRSKELDWPKRLNIILGVARGLLYLHEDSQLRIIHRDIKAGNILLDEKMQPKISDFGLARLFHLDETHVNTRVAGTLGYMAPEYALRGQLSAKADIYSFGIVILEIICGRKNSDNRLSLEFQSLVEWVWRSYEGGHIMDVIDKTLIQSIPNEQVSRYIRVGLLCTQANPSLRPPMINVYAMLSNPSMTNLPDPTKPAYTSISQNNSLLHTSTSTSTSTTLSNSSTTQSIYPSINDVTETDFGPR